MANDQKSVEQLSESELIARLKDAEARLAERESQLAQKDDEISGLQDEVSNLTKMGGARYSPNEMPIVGPQGEGYEFLVTPHGGRDDHDLKHLKPSKVKCVDESEAIRWYCQANEMRENSGIAVDPVRVRLTVKCLDEGRAKAILTQRQVAAVRKKVEANQELSAADKKLLKVYEEEIFGFSTT